MKNVQPGTAIILSGPSGAGKSTVCRKVFDLLPQTGFSISCTTRQPRPGEVHGKHYFFLSQEEFAAHRDQGDFLEYAEVHGNFYGTLRSQVEPLVLAGRNVILDIDVQGARQVRRNVVGTALAAHCVSVFMGPPSLEELERRLRGRQTETEEAIRRRLGNAAGEMAAWKEYDFVLVNDSADEAARKLAAVITAEMQRTARFDQAPWDENKAF